VIRNTQYKRLLYQEQVMLTQGTILQSRYQIIQRIGGGGMGDVYLAYDLRLGNQVVVKENRGGDPQLFYTEATLLATLHHPNLPRVIDHFVEAATGAQYLVMDYIAGQNLEQIVQARGPLREQDALAWLNQILDAVKYLHANRIIHRDIKPQNIIITPDGRAMLVDFGIAKVIRPGQPTYSAAHGIGSPGYAPLEQYTGGTDERSDVYALGATFYFALTGIEPPPAPDRANGVPLEPIRARNASVSPNTEQVIANAAAVVKSQRYQSVEALQRALYASAPPLQSTAPIQPTRAPSLAPTVPAQPRVPPWAWAVGGAGALLFIGLVLWGLFMLMMPPAPTPAPTAVAKATPAATLAPPTVTPTATPTVTPTATPTSSPVPTLRLPALAGTPVPQPTAAILPENADRVVQLARWGKGTINQVAWSPDSKQLAIASSLGIYFYDAQTGQEIRLIETNSWVRSVAFAPDGRTLASGADDNFLPSISDVGRNRRWADAGFGGG
jgi:serine/threonine protein kinase